MSDSSPELQSPKKKKRRKRKAESPPVTVNVAPNLPGGMLRKRNKELQDELQLVKGQLRERDMKISRYEADIKWLQDEVRRQGQLMDDLRRQVDLLKKDNTRLQEKERKQAPWGTRWTQALRDMEVESPPPQQQMPQQQQRQQQQPQLQHKSQQQKPQQQKVQPQERPQPQQQPKQQLQPQQQQAQQQPIQRRQQQQPPKKKKKKTVTIQLPPTADTDGRAWSEVVAGGRRRGLARANRPVDLPATAPVRGATDGRAPSRPVVGRGGAPVEKARRQERLLKRRVPQGSAVIIARKEETTAYADLIRCARQKVSPSGLGLQPVRTRYTQKGEMIVELRGGSAEAVDTFAAQLQQALGNLADVRRPQRMTTLLVLDVEESATEDEVKAAVGGDAKVVGCKPMGRGCQMVTVRLSVEGALKILERGRLFIGWSSCRVRSLERQSNAPRCFKCLKRGHISKDCRGEALGNCCYRCGEEGHQLRNCRKDPKCPVCVREGVDANHLLGAQGCLGAAPAATRSKSANRGKGSKR